MIFPVIHQPSSEGSCDDEDFWISVCVGREGGPMGVMEEGAAGLIGALFVSILLGRVCIRAAAVPVGAAAAALLTRGVAAVVVGVAESPMCLASMLGDAAATNVGKWVTLAGKGDGSVNKE